MKSYETIGGSVSRADTISRLTDHLREAEECCYVVSHLHRTETGAHDELIATGWRAIGQMLEMIRAKVINLGMGRLQ